MNCPQCADFLTNSENYVREKLSPEISVAADRLAVAAALATDNYLEYYMMHYRINYTQLFSERRASALEEFTELLSRRYRGVEGLCTACKTDFDGFNFYDEVKFCFHEGAFDVNCENCLKRLSKKNNIAN